LSSVFFDIFSKKAGAIDPVEVTLTSYNNDYFGHSFGSKKFLYREHPEMSISPDFFITMAGFSGLDHNFGHSSEVLPRL